MSKKSPAPPLSKQGKSKKGGMTRTNNAITPETAMALFDEGEFESTSPVALCPQLLGFSWLSKRPLPEIIPKEIITALETSYLAILRLLKEHRSDPIKYHCYRETFSEHTHPAIQEWLKHSIADQVFKGTNQGSKVDSQKSRPMPKTLRRRGFYIWNQFTIHGVIKPGFFWFSDSNCASFMTGVLGFEVEEHDVKNDRVHFGIKKLPQEYLLDISSTLAKCTSRKGLKK